jgi:hypothetical protein
LRINEDDEIGFVNSEDVEYFVPVKTTVAKFFEGLSNGGELRAENGAKKSTTDVNHNMKWAYEKKLRIFPIESGFLLILPLHLTFCLIF